MKPSFSKIFHLIVFLGDIDPYPNFDLSKTLRPGFENSEELKKFVAFVFQFSYQV
jgi:hypothetical protein